MASAAQVRELLKSLKEDVVGFKQAVEELERTVERNASVEPAPTEKDSPAPAEAEKSAT